MQRKKEKIDSEIDESYTYLARQNYFKNTEIGKLGYKSFLRNTQIPPPKDPLKTIWHLNRQANETYSTNPRKAYRLWIEVMLAYMELEENRQMDPHVIKTVIIFAEYIIKNIHERHSMAYKVLITIKTSLDYQQAVLQNNISMLKIVVYKAYTLKVLIVPYIHLEAYIKERLNSIYYN